MAIVNNHFAKAEMLIRKPVSEVFEAFINPEITRKFWFTKGSEKLEEGKSAEWTWEMYGFSLTVFTKIVETDKRIVIEWGNRGEETLVEWFFTPLNEKETFVSITNSNFKGDTDTILSEVRNATEGFTLVLAGAKAFLEHQLELNLVLDRFPKGVS
ncbi:polyketide cyclase [Flavobacterium cheongpyeongense]|uniref:Polyketide cyclase n=1 Tax=Flavobacterium cheongpyeongense TaxID=2212651 RepID=A0A2V4BPR4_9FLAO|nr:SRPBCC family protein [Flavobacterium cheongpyeongense]PXY40988.1 polyketide cyclase [Flavobacterium cheongpyeongense]